MNAEALIQQAIADQRIGLITRQQLLSIVYKLDRRSFIHGTKK
jgi:hypothetical protein